MNDNLKNWQAWERNSPRITSVESRLYTDSQLNGQPETVAGPVHLTLTLAERLKIKGVCPGIMLRLDLHHVYRPDGVRLETQTSHYHDGDFCDEIAALLSLFPGCRVKAGPIERDFPASGDPFGRPIVFGTKPVPTWSCGEYPQIPKVAGFKNLNCSQQLVRVFSLGDPSSSQITKIARLYQEALWIADSDPNTAWMLMISAVETAANIWRKTQQDAVEMLKTYMPIVFREISGLDPLAVTKVANELSHLLRSTAKFVDFITRFAPPPPDERPAPYACVDFNKLRKPLRTIYSHRSKFLHEGTPMPAPMCRAPRGVPSENSSGAQTEEKPIGLSHSTLGATWNSADLPMLLHTFEYIARSALIRFIDDGLSSI